MIIVLDASAGIELSLSRENSEKYGQVLERSTKVISSDLYKAEVTNVLWKYFKAGQLSKEETFKCLHYCEDLVDEFVDISSNNEEALLEGIRIRHSVYDLLYLTLARRNGATLLTQDKKLKEIAKQNGIEVY